MTSNVRDDRWALVAFAGAWFLALLGIGAHILTGTFDIFVDAHAYWATGQGPMYSPDYELWKQGYSYPPAFAQLISPITLVPWPTVRVAWAVAVFSAYAWLLWDVRLSLRIPLLIACMVWAPDNLYWALALVAVLGFRYPSLWALPILTKIGPGVGVLWFVVRREWRSFAISVGTVVIIGSVSFVADPDAWRTWVGLMVRQDVAATGRTFIDLPIPSLPIRLGVACLIVGWGALTGQRWTVPVAMIVGQPDINFPTLGLLAALPRTLAAPSVPAPIDLMALRRRVSR